jgi:hypothetical protein
MTNWTETHWTRILNYDLFTGEDVESSWNSTEQDESSRCSSATEAGRPRNDDAIQ